MQPHDTSPPLHALPPGAALDRLETAASGLSAAEAARRQARYGANVLPEPAQRPAVLRFLRQFNNVLIYVLIGSAMVTAAQIGRAHV